MMRDRRVNNWSILIVGALCASMLLVTVSFAQTQTPPVASPTAVLSPSTLPSTAPTVAPAVLAATALPAATPTPNPGFLERTAGNWIGFAGALIVALLGFWQWRRSSQLQRELEEKKLAWDREKLQWDREKLDLETQAALKRK